MTSSQKERMSMIHGHLDFVHQIIKKLDQVVAPYDNAITIPCTNPRIDRNPAITMLSEIGTNMKQFNSSKHLCCWARPTPSASKKKSVRITHSRVYLKLVLEQCGHAAVRFMTPPTTKTSTKAYPKEEVKREPSLQLQR